MSVLTLWLVLLSSCLLTVRTDEEMLITVSNQENGTEAVQCISDSSSITCTSLNKALEVAQQYNYVTMLLLDDRYVLSANDTTTSFQDMSKFELIGMDTIVLIECDLMTGLSFYNSSNITFKNINFSGCGTLHNSSSIDFSKPVYPTMSYLEFLAGLYFLLCSDIELEYVTVSDTPGTGVVFYSVSGDNYITYSNFTNNTATHDDYIAGGGALAIEFLYCLPGDILCSPRRSSYIPLDNQMNSNYKISNCIFENNNGSTGNYTEDSFVVPHWNYNVALGRGGGLLLLMKGNATNNTITLESCVFRDNIAVWGGGLALEFQDKATSNEVIVRNCLFMDNECDYDSCNYQGTGGGGARIQMAGVDREIKDNSVSFSKSKFHNNHAYFGGGVSFFTFPEDTITNSIVFNQVEWMNNIARLGSAVDLSRWHLTTGFLLEPVFIDCNFTQNTVEYTQRTGTPQGAGTVYADTVSIVFERNVTFLNNIGSAIVSTDGKITFADSTTATFESNNAEFGAAIALYNMAHLLLNEGVHLKFTANIAKLHGGAIYWEGIGNHELVSSRNCFIRYTDSFVDPSEWPVMFEFINNTAGLSGNAIYGTTLLGCLWGGRPYGQLLDPQDEYKNVFCWNSPSPSIQSVWNYVNSSCNESIATSPGYFAYENGTVNCGAQFNLSIIPGTISTFPVEMLDDRMTVVPEKSIIFSSFVNQTNISVQYTAFENIPFFGASDTIVQYKLASIRPRIISTEINLTFKKCPPGFLLDQSNLECVGANYPFVLTRTNLTSSIQRGYWIGEIDNRTVVAQCSYCPYNTELPLSNYIDLPQDHSELEEFFCKDLQREGPLCRRCIEGYAPAVNSEVYKCVKCTAENAKYSWLLYLLTEYVPTTIILLIVIIFNISVTSGPLNSFVFFAQVISTTFGVDADGLIPYPSITSAAEGLKHAYISIYGVWNLNFFLSFDWALFCLGPNVTTLHLLALDFIQAVYPLLLLIVIWILVTLYYSNYRIVVCIVRPLHRLFARSFGLLNLQRSIMDAFATFIVLSYAKFAATSAVLLYPNGLYTETGETVSFVSKYDGNYPFDSSQYSPFLVSSILTSLLICILMPVLLLLYSLKPFYRLLEKIHFTYLLPGEKASHFLNSFFHCYKDGANGGYDQRYFASLLFFIKLIIIFSYSYALNWAQQYIIQQVLCTIAILMISVFQPYKRMLYNIVDACMFTILAFINILTLYNRYLDIADLGLSSSSYYIQIVLIFSPLVYIVSYVIHCIYHIKSVKTNVTIVKEKTMALFVSKKKSKGNIQSNTNTDFDFDDFMDDVTHEGRLYQVQYHGPLKPDELNRDVGDEYNAMCQKSTSESTTTEIITLRSEDED